MRKFTLLILSASLAFADFAYEQRSQVTGGAMAGMMRMAGAFSKKLREPMSTWTYVKGNKIAHVSGSSATVYDIDAETITEIDHEKRTYTVVTFAQMREEMANAMAKMKDRKDAPQDIETQVQVDVKETGRTKQLAGATANEHILSFIMVMKDKKGKESAEMETQSSVWMAKSVSGWQELNEAQKRLGLKMASAFGGTSPFGGGAGMNVQPGMNESWAALGQKMSKMEGIPMLTIVRMGPKGQLPPASTFGQPKPASQQQEAEADKPKAGDVLAGALGGRLGGFGRKRKESGDKEQMPQKRTEPASSEGAMLMEMTTETTSVSSAAIDAAKLAVPAGYQKVDRRQR